MHTDTVEAILNNNVKTAALNFADAYTPGGLVLFGVKTQEEDLCRSSNLYESLTLPIIKNYNNKIILKIWGGVIYEKNYWRYYIWMS